MRPANTFNIFWSKFFVRLISKKISFPQRFFIGLSLISVFSAGCKVSHWADWISRISSCLVFFDLYFASLTIQIVYHFYSARLFFKKFLGCYALLFYCDIAAFVRRLCLPRMGSGGCQPSVYRSDHYAPWIRCVCERKAQTKLQKGKHYSLQLLNNSSRLATDLPNKSVTSLVLNSIWQKQFNGFPSVNHQLLTGQLHRLRRSQ